MAELGIDGWVRVQWDNGQTNSYRMGKEGKYDLKLADPPPLPQNDTDSVDIMEDEELHDGSSSGKHPTGLIRHSCLQLMRIFAVSIGLHSDDMEDSALRSFSGLIREIVWVCFVNNVFLAFDCICRIVCLPQIGSTVRCELRQTEKEFLCCEQFEEWANLGFIRGITVSVKICEFLSSPSWITMCLDLIEKASEFQLDLPSQVLVLRLLRAVLPCANGLNPANKATMLERIGRIIGIRILIEIKDPSIENQGNS